MTVSFSDETQDLGSCIPDNNASSVDESGIVELDNLDLDYWYQISEFCISNWAFAFLGLGTILFLFDWGMDIALIILYSTQGQWMEFALTLSIVIIAGVITSLLYHINQTWIDENNEHLETATENEKKLWEFARDASKLLLLSPIFRAVLCWKDLGQKQNFINTKRARRLPVTRDEVGKVVTLSERDLANTIFTSIEALFETLPQSMLQIYIAAVMDKATFQLTTYEEGMRFCSIFMGILISAFLATKYMMAYHIHLQALQFEDHLIFKQRIPFVKLDRISIIFLFFTNILVIGSRTYAIAYMLVVYGFGSLVFTLVLFAVQFFWLQRFSQVRTKYENPPHGVTTVCSNLVDRWFNLFTFHMIHPNVFNISTFHTIFLLTFLSFSGVFSAYFPQAKMANTTVLCSLSQFNFAGDCTYLDIFSSFELAITLGGISFVVSLLYVPILRREKELLRAHFPLTKAYRFWQEFFDGKIIVDDADMRRHICLCVIASDVHLYKVTDHFNFTCGEGRRKCNLKLNNLWEQELAIRFNGQARKRTILLEELTETLRQIICTNPTMSMISDMVNAIIADKSVSIQDLQMFIIMCRSFEATAVQFSSHRLSKIKDILSPNDHKYCCLTSLCSGEVSCSPIPLPAIHN